LVHTSAARYDFPRAGVELVDLNFYDVAAFADGFSLTVAEYLLVESFHLDQTVVFVQAWRQVVGKEVELVDGAQEHGYRVGVCARERAKVVLGNIYGGLCMLKKV
jgi:hypothetical protein